MHCRSLCRPVKKIQGMPGHRKACFRRGIGKCCIFWVLISVGIFSECAAESPVTYSRVTPVVRAVKMVSPAVVNISSEYEVRDRVNPFFHFPVDPFFRDFFDHGYERKRKLSSLGSGVIIDGEKGLILTNEHVIVKTGTITVVLNDGREFKADIVGADPETDLAVLRVRTSDPLPAIAMGDSTDLMIGETVIAIGNPFGFANTVTTGVISALNRSIRAQEREYHDFIQTDASINPGNSGGPLLNINGELIGINTAIYAEAQGIGFAIPISKAAKIITDLIIFGEVVQAWIGVTVRNIDPQLAQYWNISANTGVVVKHVEAESPAMEADIREGDILTRLNHTPIGSVGEFEMRMRSVATGEMMDLGILRKSESLTKNVRTSVFPENLALPLAWRLLGVKVVSLDQKNRSAFRISAPSGVMIEAIDHQSALARINARPGDVIRQMNEVTIATMEDFKKAITKYRWKESVVVLLQRGDSGYYITLRL